MNELSSKPPQYNNDGSIQVELANQTIRLTADQIKLLYALAESDWGWLPYQVLHKVVWYPHWKRYNQVKPPTSEQETHLAQQLQQLEEMGLTICHQPQADHAGLTQAGLQLITQLTRHWPGWAAYSEQSGLIHY